MIINPKEIQKAGYVTNVTDDLVQQNGIDIELDILYRLEGQGFVPRKGQVRLAEMIEVPLGGEEEDSRDYFLMKGEAYIAHAKQKVRIPKDMGAYVIIRSSLNRCGCFFASGWYDSGYEGPIGGVLRPRLPIVIEQGARIAQIIFFKADSASMYNGRYQEKIVKEMMEDKPIYHVLTPIEYREK